MTDGFPRNIDQVELLVELVKRHAWSITAIYIVVSDRVAVERLSHRVTVVDGQEVRRDDDKPEIVQKRLHNFRDQTLPVINWIGNNYKLIKINGEQSIEGVTEDISKAIDNG